MSLFRTLTQVAKRSIEKVKDRASNPGSNRLFGLENIVCHARHDFRDVRAALAVPVGA